MSILTILLLAVSLSMDALGIGISYGLRGIHTPWKARVIICVISMAVTGAAVGLGSALLLILPKNLAKVLGCGMLLILGVLILVQAYRKRNQEDSYSCDFDQSKTIETLEAVYLGVALSVDSFGAGVSSAVSGLNSILVPLAAGVFQMLFLCLGDLAGKKLHLMNLKNPQVFVYLSGALLIVIGLIRWIS